MKREEERVSESVTNGQSRLATSLAKAQAKFPAVKKTRTAKAGAYAYDYADLSDILHAVMPVLGQNEIALTQRYSVQEGTILLETILLHASGEMLSSVLPITNGGNPSAQQIGSLMTYMRRYAVTALLGIAAEDDDDGASAAPPARAPQRVHESSGGSGGELARHAAVATRKADGPRAAPPANLANEKQRRLVWARAKAKGDELGLTDDTVTTGLKRVLADLGFNSSREITGPAIDGILSVIAGWTLDMFGEPEPPSGQMETGDGAF